MFQARPARGFAGPQWSAGGLREDSTLGESRVARFEGQTAKGVWQRVLERFWRCFRKLRIEFRCVFFQTFAIVGLF